MRANSTNQSIRKARAAFCELMIKARKGARLTQSDLAYKLRKPQSFVAKYEGGERRIDVVEFVTICQVIGADSSKLLKSLKKAIDLP